MVISIKERKLLFVVAQGRYGKLVCWGAHLQNSGPLLL